MNIMSDLSHQLRHLFDLPPPRGGTSVIDLRSFTHGLPPVSVKRNLELFYEEWRTSGVDAWNSLAVSGDIFLIGDETMEERERTVGWWNLPEVLGDRFISRLLHAPQGTCIMLPNATQIVFGLLSCPELHGKKKGKVICTDGEFPAVLHTLRHQQSFLSGLSSGNRQALQIEVLPMRDRAFDREAVLRKIGEDTALVILSHIGFLSGERIIDDAIRAIADACHRYGASSCSTGITRWPAM
jgi:kynureninase